MKNTIQSRQISYILQRVCKVIVTISVNFGISYALNSSRHSPSAVSYEKGDKILTLPLQHYS